MTAQREETLAPSQLIHPERIGDALTWVPGRGLDDLADELRAFDSRLTLAFHGGTKCWEIWRFEAGQYSLVGRSRPGLAFPGDVVGELRNRDSRSGFDPAKAAEAHNASRDAEIDRRTHEFVGEKAARAHFYANRRA